MKSRSWLTAESALRQVRTSAFFSLASLFFCVTSASVRRILVSTVRTAGDPLALDKPVHAAIGQVDKDLVLTRIQTLDEVAEESMVQPRFRAILAVAFALAALALAALGVYGVLAFAVTQRVKEFGIRLALGATASGLLRLVLRDGLRIVMVGLAVRLVAAAFLTRFISGSLYGSKRWIRSRSSPCPRF